MSPALNGEMPSKLRRAIPRYGCLRGQSYSRLPIRVVPREIKPSRPYWDEGFFIL